jgi:hypothetical protein
VEKEDDESTFNDLKESDTPVKSLLSSPKFKPLNFANIKKSIEPFISPRRQKTKDILQIKNKDVDYKTTITKSANRKYFKEFCINELNSENVEFWEQIKYRYKKYSSVEQRKEFGDLLYQTYIDPLSQRQLNLNKKCQDEVKRRLDGAEEFDNLIDLFDEVKREVEINMQDAFHRFRQSIQYKKMVQEIVTEEEKLKSEEESSLIRRDSCLF